jgi:hypothetical protein
MNTKLWCRIVFVSLVTLGLTCKTFAPANSEMTKKKPLFIESALNFPDTLLAGRMFIDTLDISYSGNERIFIGSDKQLSNLIVDGPVIYWNPIAHDSGQQEIHFIAENESGDADTLLWNVYILSVATRNDELIGFPKAPIGGCLVAEDTLWLAGNDSVNYYHPGLWRSSDAVHWTKVTDSIPVPQRRSPSFFIFNKRIWMLGGLSISEDFNKTFYASSEEFVG